MAKKEPQKNLDEWTKQEWTTSDGSESKGKKRYLPKKAWDELTPAEKAATNKTKAEGNRKGKQYVDQPKKIAEKTRKHRKGG